MQTLKLILKIAAYFIVATITIALGLYFFRDYFYETSIYVEQADIRDLEAPKINLSRNDPREVSGINEYSFHEIFPANKTVFSFIRFNEGTSAIDDESRDYLTLALNTEDIKEGSTINISDKNIKVVYTNKSTVWKGLDCTGLGEAGSIKVIRTGGSSITLRIDAKIKIFTWPSCKDKISETITFSKKPFEDYTLKKSYEDSIQKNP